MPVLHHLMIAVYVLGIIFWSISHSGALHFNPVMGFIGYRFYRVRNGDGTVQLLISKSELRRGGSEVETVRLAQPACLQLGGRRDWETSARSERKKRQRTEQSGRAVRPTSASDTAA